MSPRWSTSTSIQAPIPRSGMVVKPPGWRHDPGSTGCRSTSTASACRDGSFSCPDVQQLDVRAATNSMGPVPPQNVSTDFDSRLLIHSTEPLVGGPPLSLLRQNFITPTGLFFVRNHGPVPAVEPTSFRLEVSGLVGRSLSLSIAELRERFPRHTVTATLMCAGNRRNELMEVAPIPGEVPWTADGIGTAEWSGVRLKDVLDAAGLADAAAHVAFEGLDQVTRHGETFGLGG